MTIRFIYNFVLLATMAACIQAMHVSPWWLLALISFNLAGYVEGMLASLPAKRLTR